MSKIQYTIRNIPAPVDQALRKRAKQTGKSFNQTVIEALNMQLFNRTDIDNDLGIESLFGKGAKFLDEEFDKAMAEQEEIDMEWWNDPGHTRL